MTTPLMLGAIIMSADMIITDNGKMTQLNWWELSVMKTYDSV